MKRTITITDKNDNLVNGEIDIRQKDAYISLDDTLLGSNDKIENNMYFVNGIPEMTWDDSNLFSKASASEAANKLGISEEMLEALMAGRVLRVRINNYEQAIPIVSGSAVMLLWTSTGSLSMTFNPYVLFKNEDQTYSLIEY